MVEDKFISEQFCVEYENYHIYVSFAHFTTPSKYMIHPVLEKRRKGTYCEILFDGIDLRNGSAYLNPKDDCGFVFKTGRKVSFSRTVHHIKSKKLRSILWDAFLQFNQ